MIYPEQPLNWGCYFFCLFVCSILTITLQKKGWGGKNNAADTNYGFKIFTQ